MTPERSLRRVVVVSLGGTIASTHAAPDSGGVVPRLDAADLVAAVPGLEEVAAVEAISFRQVPSDDLSFDDIVALAERIEVALANGVDGVVVTQGTDSIEETSFILDLLVHSACPVVVTGAMRNPTVAGADGPANLLAGVRVAASVPARGLGTLVVFNDEVHAARFVRKMNTSNPATFQSPGCGALGWVVEDRVSVAVRVARLAPLPRPRVTVPPVALIRLTLGDDGRLLESLVDLGYAGAVIEGFGGGHAPSVMVARLEALARAMPVVLASRTGSGEILRGTYGYAGSERDLLLRGLVHGGSLDGLKARVLLSLLASIAPDDVRQRFADVVATVTPDGA